jgi:hypothetical protein
MFVDRLKPQATIGEQVWQQNSTKLRPVPVAAGK